MNVPLTAPTIEDAEVRAVSAVLRSGWLTQGPQVAAFEREFAETVGATHACAVSSCTTALHLALRAVGVSAGDEVVTVSHSFIATANVIRYCGATPVFVDIDAATYNMDPTQLEAALTPRTKAILCVHQMGMPCDLQTILCVAERANIVVIEDAACAVGSEILVDGRWERIGKPHGDIACFSFHPRKIITTGEGGMLVTANPEWDRLFRLWRQHGMSVSDTVRHGADRVMFETYEVLGYNYRMTDLQAAIGREQLKRLTAIIRRRRELGERYNRLLGEIAGIVRPSEPEWAHSNWQSYCVRLPKLCDQVAVMQALLDRGIATRRGIMCAHREPAYTLQDWRHVGSLRRSEEAQDHTVILPLFPGMTDAQQDAVAAALADVCQESIVEIGV